MIDSALMKTQKWTEIPSITNNPPKLWIFVQVVWHGRSSWEWQATGFGLCHILFGWVIVVEDEYPEDPVIAQQQSDVRDWWELRRGLEGYRVTGGLKDAAGWILSVIHGDNWLIEADLEVHNIEHKVAKNKKPNIIPCVIHNTVFHIYLVATHTQSKVYCIQLIFNDHDVRSVLGHHNLQCLGTKF